MCGEEGRAKRKAHILPTLPAEKTLLFMLRRGQGLSPESTGLSRIPCPVSEGGIWPALGTGRQHGGQQVLERQLQQISK